MRFAIATHSFLLVITLDKDWTVKEYKVLNTGHHYGIGLCNQGKGKLICDFGGKDLIVFEKDEPFSLLGSISTGGQHGKVHQVCYANDGIYLANTEYNSIIYQSLVDKSFHEYFFDSVRYDRNHINSVFPDKQRIVVLLHNHFAPSEVAVLRHDRTEGFQFQKRISLWHSGCHNIYLDDHRLMYNASAKGLFVTVDLPKRKIERILRFPGHTKGLCIIDKHILIGFSDHAVREARTTSRGHLAVIDKESLDIVKTVDVNFPDLPHPVGNVNEIRCLTETDYAHYCTERINDNVTTMRLARFTFPKVLLGKAKITLKRLHQKYKTQL